jgi:hypothetical protein
MAETLVAVAVGLASAGLGWAVARRSGPAGTTRYRAVMLASFFAFLTLGSSTLLPHARSWQQERDVEDMLHSEPLFAAVLENEPPLREPLRAALLTALRVGPRSEALLVGQRFLSPQLWRYVPRASDAAALALGRALVGALSRLQARDPQQCYRFLYPAVAGPGSVAAQDQILSAQDQILPAWRTVLTSTRDGSAEPLDRRAAGKALETAFRRLRERHGKDVDVLKNPQAPGADRARVCAMTIALYSELVALPPGSAGSTLRHVLGPAEPAAAVPQPPTGP